MTKAPGANASSPMPWGNILRIMFPLAVADLVATFETSMVYGAFKTILEEFGDPVAVGWLVTGYLLVAASAAAIVGRLGDMLGRRKVLLIVIAITIFGSVISALSSSLIGIIIGRAIQGFAIAILPLCYGLIKEHLRSDVVPICIGVILATSSIGTSLGLIGGGAIIDHFNWRGIFIASGIFGGIAFAISYFLLPKSKTINIPAKIDIVGGALFVPAVAAILYAVSSASDWGWLNPRTLGLITFGVALTGGWYFYERQHSAPLINVRLLSDRSISMTYICLILAGLGSMQILQFFMLIFQQPAWTGAGHGLSATLAGIFKLPSTAATIITSPIAGWLCVRWGSRYVAATGMSFCTIAWLCVMFNLDNFPLSVAMLALCGVGVGGAYTAVSTIIVAVAPNDRVSEAAGFLTVLRSISAAIGAQLLVVALSTSTISNSELGPGEFPTAEAYKFALTMLCGFSILATLAAFCIPTRKK